MGNSCYRKIEDGERRGTPRRETRVNRQKGKGGERDRRKKSEKEKREERRGKIKVTDPLQHDFKKRGRGSETDREELYPWRPKYFRQPLDVPSHPGVCGA